MASITVRNIEDSLKARLWVQAANNRRSMEEEARQILRHALAEQQPGNLADFASEIFGPEHGFDLDPHPRMQRGLCTLAGLAAHTQNLRLDETQIFEAMRDAFIDAGGVPTRTRFDRHFRHSVDVLKRRGWSWRGAGSLPNMGGVA